MLPLRLKNKGSGSILEFNIFLFTVDFFQPSTWSFTLSSFKMAHAWTGGNVFVEFLGIDTQEYIISF